MAPTLTTTLSCLEAPSPGALCNARHRHRHRHKLSRFIQNRNPWPSFPFPLESAWVALINWREIDLPKKEVRVSNIDVTPSKIPSAIFSALIMLFMSNTFFCISTTVPFIFCANLVSKLSDFGICRILSNRSSSDNATQLWRTDPKGTFVYMDPEFLASGELTPKSDVYSFGIILMRLLTGRQALGISKEVKYAVDTGKLKSLLDPLAGDWPFVQAEQLAHLALRCCEMSRKSRPDLCSDVWRILDAMRASSGGTNSFGLSSEGLHQPPSYFICPIFQEVMRDPHVAADGFTYEAEAIRGWLDSGHDTSPMTNSKLAHQNLVPNRALRSAIQDWLQSQ